MTAGPLVTQGHNNSHRDKNPSQLSRWAEGEGPSGVPGTTGRRRSCPLLCRHAAKGAGRGRNKSRDTGAVSLGLSHQVPNSIKSFIFATLQGLLHVPQITTKAIFGISIQRFLKNIGAYFLYPSRSTTCPESSHTGKRDRS